MLIAYVKVNVIKAKRIEFEQTVFALRREFRQTTGCLSYDIYKDTEQGTAYFLISEWHNQAALESHFQTNHFDVLIGAINNLCEPTEVKFRIASLLDNSESPAPTGTGNILKGEMGSSGMMNFHL